jgi:hypothetical protein
MPKPSGAEMKITRLAPRPQPQARPIKSFVQPPPAPPPSHGKPPQGGSNEIAAHAVRVASTPGKIDPRQMRY